jgi:2-methylcitrate dehydratase PrpD
MRRGEGNYTEVKSIAKVLAKFVCDLSYKDLSKNVSEMAKTRILDFLSSCFAATSLALYQMALAVVKDSVGETTVIRQRRGYAIRDAAFVNGVLAHSVLQEDSQKEGGHPSTIVVPATLAVAEQEGASGAQVIVAIVIGYELMKRITIGTPAESRREGLLGGFRNSTVFGIFGAAAAAAKLMNLGEKQVLNAIGHSASLASGLTEGWASGTLEFPFQAGLAAQNGIMAARIAQVGVTASETSLEGVHGFYRSYAGTTKNINRITSNLGESFAISEVRCKPYSACGSNQESMALGQYLLQRHSLQCTDIARVVEKTSLKKKGYPGIDAHPPYRGGFSAMMSAQFCLASALLKKPVNSFKFFNECYADPDVAELAKKIELVGEEGRGMTRLEVYLEDGREYHIEEDASDILIPTWENTETKFRSLASEALREERISEIINMVKALDTLGNMQQFTCKLRF